MSSIEERLARDIAAVTGGVVVTDSDLREARSAVNDRIEGRRRRDRRRVVMATAAAAVVLAAVGVTAFALLNDDDSASVRPSGPTPTVNESNSDFLTGRAPTPELIHGVWRLDNGSTLVHFFSSGTVQFDEQGILYSKPVLTGAYTVDGDVISVTITQTEQPGCLGKTFAVRASLPRAGLLRFVSSQGTDIGCSPVPAAQGVWEQALPTRNNYLAGLDNSQFPGWHPLSGKAALAGVFLAGGGGGYLLELDADGSYYVAAPGSDDPVDQGQWSLHGSDLTLTSSDSSTECSKGDTLVLGSLEEVFPGTTVFRGTVQQNTCGAPWTPDEWILIPNASSG